jgi:excisionase family DNA binding protein
MKDNKNGHDKADRLAISRNEMARLLDVSLRTVDRLIAHHEIPVLRVGSRLVRIPMSSLHAFITERTHV